MSRAEGGWEPGVDVCCIAVFIYSMPGYSVPIKERMMYSSCRNAVVQVIETSLNIALEKKLEISSGSELTEQFLQVLSVGHSQ